MAPPWLEAGMTEQRHSGLSRALFGVRLLELQRAGTAEDRFAFLVGAFIATDLDALVARGVFARDARVVICGHAAIAEAWAYALKNASRTAVVVPEEDTEQAFLAGLNQILIEAISSSESTRHLAGKREPHGRS
jgi:2-keto-3-deoxy-galactonokinase